MSQEKVREIFSHVDMTKIDLSSFKIGAKKFDELSHLYRNRVVLSCLSIIMHKEHHSSEEVDYAFTMVDKIAANPDLYSYDCIYASERQSVDDAIDEITLRRDRGINDVKIKAIEKRIKDAYKQMRKTLEMALANGNLFEEEFNEETISKCIELAQNAIANGKKQAEEEYQAANLTSVESNVHECDATEARPKVSFWKRLFCKA